jgi:S1-C subfamily serine protease
MKKITTFFLLLSFATLASGQTIVSVYTTLSDKTQRHGTGFFIDKDLIVTAYHVIQGASELDE